MTPEMQGALNGVEQQAYFLNAQKEKIDKLDKAVMKESGLSLEQFTKMQELEKGFESGKYKRTSFQAVPGGGGMMYTPSPEETIYNSLKQRYEAAKDRVVPIIQREATQTYGLINTNIEKDIASQQLIKNAVNTGSIPSDGATNEEMQRKLTLLSGKNYTLDNVRVHPHTKRVTFDAIVKGGKEGEPDRIQDITVDFTNRDQEWNRILPSGQQYEQSIIQTEMRNMLKTRGSLQVNGSYHYFNNYAGIPMKATPVRDQLSGGYNLMIDTEKGTVVIPGAKLGPAFQDPLTWMQTKFPEWATMMKTELQKQHTYKNKGKTDPDYKPTATDFYDFYYSTLLPNFNQ